MSPIIEKTMAQQSQTPCRYNQNITDFMLEEILTRIAGGETLRAVALDLKVSAALVRKRGYDNEVWGARLREARRMSADQSFEEMLVVARDTSLPVADRRLIVEVLKDIAKVGNRAVYGDKIAIDHRAVIVNITDDDLGLC